MQLDELFDGTVDYHPTSLVAQADAAAGGAAGGETASAGAASAGAAEPWYRTLPTGGGVYLLTDEADRLVQLASAADLRRALRARLSGRKSPAQAQAEQKEQPEAGTSRRPDLAQVVRKIRWRSAHSTFETDLDYLRIARLLIPEAYLKQLGFGPAWFVHADPAAAFPRFATGKVLRSPPGTDLGPFATHADATRFVQTLEDTFDLCRYHQVLEQAPAGQACAYFEMGRCAAPCNGSIPMTEYRAAISAALAFAAGQRAEMQARWANQMQAAAQTMAFEQANALKQRLERARALEHKAYRLVRPIEQFCYLVVQRGPGRTRVKPFFVCAGRITAGPAVKLQDVGQVAGEWIINARQAPSDPPHLTEDPRRQELSERIWLVSHYLFKKQTPGLFIHAADLPGPEELTDRIKAHFGPKAKPADPQAGNLDTGGSP